MNLNIKTLSIALLLCSIDLTRSGAWGSETQRGTPSDSIPKCGVEHFFGSCDELNKRMPIFKKYEDGTWLPNIGQMYSHSQ